MNSLVELANFARKTQEIPDLCKGIRAATAAAQIASRPGGIENWAHGFKGIQQSLSWVSQFQEQRRFLKESFPLSAIQSVDKQISQFQPPLGTSF